MSCVVPNCKQKYRRLLPADSNISFHKFPKNESMFRKWLEAIGRTDPNISWSKSMLICSEHFKPEQLVLHPFKTHLVENAVPERVYREGENSFAMKGLSEDLLDIQTETLSTGASSECEADTSAQYLSNEIKTEQNDLFINCNSTEVLLETVSSRINESRFKTSGIKSENKYLGLEHTPQICKTCDEEFIGDPHLVSSSLNNSRTTCRDMIIQLVPQMEDKFNDTDIICARCYDILTSCVQFIHRCLQAEAKFQDDSDIVKEHQNGEDVMEFETDGPVSFEEITKSSSTIKSNGDAGANNDDHCYVYKPKPRLINPLPEDVDDADRVISVKRPDDKVLGSLIANLSTTGIRVFNCYSKSKSQLSTKRVLLLGTAIPPKLIKCEECGKMVRSNRMLLKHHQTHKRVRERKARMRKMALQKKEERERMRQQAKLEAKTRIRCSTCGDDCKTKEELKEHIQSHPLLVCEVCGKGFAERYRLNIHMRTHNQTKSYVCHICGRCYGTMSLLRQHVSRHEEGKFLCYKCPKIFRHTMALKNHLKRHDSISLYECKECGKKCKTKAAHRSHYRLVHLKNGNFKCEICGEGFVRGDYLKRHVKRHMKSEYELETRPSNDSGPFMCKICNKVFPKLLGLKHHLFTHASLKPYRCKYCGLTFNRMPNKYRHEKRHEKDSSFNNKCPVCWRLCQNEEELKEHISHHPTPYQCEFCELSFARRYLLTHHVSENHTVANEEAMYYESILQESLEVKYPRTEFLFENDAAET